MERMKTLWTTLGRMTCGFLAASTIAAGGCATDPSNDMTDDDALTIAANLGPEACTQIVMDSPTAGWTAELGQTIPLAATATCGAGSTPEYQFWVKGPGATQWTILGPFMQSGWSWTPPSPGAWAVTAVARNVGSHDTYQARAASAKGSVGGANRGPVAGNDTITTPQNVPGSVDVIGNDSDPDGDNFAIVSHTNPLHGSVIFSGTVATYSPTPGFVGADSFTYSIEDGRGGTSTATVSVTVTNTPPLAADDVIATFINKSSSTNVLANDRDPDGDAISVTSWSNGAHGQVTIANGLATYTPDANFQGPDSFDYTITDAHGATDVGTVNVDVSAAGPACNIQITGPDTGKFGEPIHLSASAQCASAGPVTIQWMKRINSAFIVVKPFSPSPELDFTADSVGLTTFMAIARVGGMTPGRAPSNAFNVRVADNVAPCTAVRMTSPGNTAVLSTGQAIPLTAAATCPADTTPEFQFWVKPSGAQNWSPLPGYTTDAGSWTPPTAGKWNLKAVVRGTNAHVNYQAASMAVAVTVIDE